MDSAKSQLVDRLKTANTVLITVSRNPSVDQLAACIGLTLVVNKLNKHGSAVFSGDIPSTIEFLKPEDTIEKNTDSLRDFIIALDKNKADKLRYKVEDQTVRIFITPYRTSLSESDLEFSQGDFNVELIIALGVQNQEDLDQAITAHGRILHDATVASINTQSQSSLGSINWVDPGASSLCELVSNLSHSLGDKLLDEQIATALLTGIVAETERFSNEKTTSNTMSISSELMAAGANQQLVATKLAEPLETDDSPINQDQQTEGGEAGDTDAAGTLSIEHPGDEADQAEVSDIDVPETSLPAPVDLPAAADQGTNIPPDQEPPADNNQPSVDEALLSSSKFVSEPPQLGGVLTANSRPEAYEPSSDPLSNITMPTSGDSGLTKSSEQIKPLTPSEDENSKADQQAPSSTNEPMPTGFTPPPPAWVPTFNDKQLEDKVDKTLNEPDTTLNDLEETVDSPHLQPPNIDDARDQVDEVLAQSTGDAPAATESLNAMPLGDPLHVPSVPTDENTTSEPKSTDTAPPDEANIHNTPVLDPSRFSEPPAPEVNNQETQAPPVPPPIPVPYNFGHPGEQPEPPST